MPIIFQHPPIWEPTVDAPRLTCCAAIVQVHKGCPLSLFIPPHSLGLLDSGLPCSSFGESRNKKRDNRDLVSHPRSVKSLVPPLAPEQCLPYSLPLHTHNGVRILRSRATPDWGESTLSPCTLTMGLGFSDPGRPPTDERVGDNAPRPDVGGL